MRVDEFKFKVTKKSTNESAIISLNDLYGYEGEVCGTLIRYDIDIPNGLKGEIINYNSGYGFKGINEDVDIEIIKTTY